MYLLDPTTASITPSQWLYWCCFISSTPTTFNSFSLAAQLESIISDYTALSPLIKPFSASSVNISSYNTFLRRLQQLDHHCCFVSLLPTYFSIETKSSKYKPAIAIFLSFVCCHHQQINTFNTHCRLVKNHYCCSNHRLHIQPISAIGLGNNINLSQETLVIQRGCIPFLHLNISTQPSTCITTTASKLNPPPITPVTAISFFSEPPPA